ncbi:DUF2911 domain-containing protein [Aequorivita sp. F47161]|uniref:DUF2911 domain-containing protein n=1 Tax=Aequorivita vitellina TaxID=2874475 RepID=A0A9X1TZY5_9FLAO|nr:DUF2911 domain-containing protein [Aequorivita vitellina]MCG2418534.1 DUF2911 domain-containing protein [Aequorivita vitellina]MCZ4319321.1 DUF2911 domain-containing protein [Aequorivita viscosa]
MKKIFLITCFLVTTFAFQSVNAQSFPQMDASPMDLAMARPDKNSPPMARVIYSRPQKKGRDIFGDLVPYGEVWRTGANEATELTIYIPLKFGKTILNPGTYTLYTIPGEDEWTIIVNSDTNVWGAYSYKKDKDVARITVECKDSVAPIESLSMIFKPEKDGTTLLIGWDDHYVEIPFKKA